MSRPAAMNAFLVSFWSNRNGATSIEYAAFAVFIGVALLIALNLVSPSVKDIYALIGMPKS
jgi:Flp pilus assembly pilin Flp